MNNPIKIAIEASNLITAQPTGIPKYSFNLISGLANTAEFNSQFDLTLLLSLSRWKKRHHCPVKEVKKSWYVKRLLLKNNFKLIHYTESFHNQNKNIPKVATVHDVAVLKKENAIPNYTAQDTVDRTQSCMADIAKNSNAIIFVSETTRQDFLNLYSFPEKQTFVVYLGSNFASYQHATAAAASILDKYKIKSKQYFLFLGGISIRKNALNLVKAFLLNQHKTDLDLVLVGNEDMSSALIHEEIQRHDAKGRIKYLGFVTDAEIIELYQNAAAFVFPTYYEGFGIPIIDAMNFEVPVLIGNKGGAPEIAGNFATMVDPFDPGSIAEGLGKVLITDSDRLQKAKEYAQGFTWQRCAQKTLNVYKTLL